jgi:hypothetical protein
VQGVLVAGIIALSAVSVGSTRPWLADTYHSVGAASDVYALPDPDQMVVASLGHRSAFAGMLFAKTLVDYGIHVQEKRHFQFGANYLETIIALDPKIRDVYYYADTMLTLQSVPTPESDVVKARQIVERGLKEFPQDAELWLTGGQFVAYLGSSRLSDLEARKEWRLAGARMMAQACSMFDERVSPRRCVGAVTTLTRAGERSAVIQVLERLLAVADDPDTRARAEAWLAVKLKEERQNLLVLRRELVDKTREADLGWIDRSLYAVLPPPFQAPACAGAFGAEECATRWRDFRVTAEEAAELDGR